VLNRKYRASKSPTFHILNVSGQFGGTQKNLLKKEKLKYRILLISLFLIVWSIVFDSPFQKGGIDRIFHYIIFIIFLLISFVYLLTIESFILAERVLYSFLLSFLSLSVGFLITGKILEKIYGADYEMYLSNSIANLLLYSLVNLFLIFAVLFIKRIKK